MLTMLMISIMFSIMFLFLSHPLSMGLILLLQTVSTSLITGMLNYNFWFSYILFLIMVGGMLILFIYMTSIASNEKFKFSPKLLILTTLLMMLILISILMDKFLPNMMMSTYDLMNQEYQFNNKKSMTKFLNKPSSLNLYMIIIYLFITLIMTVKITKIQYGPLRQKF